MINLESEFSPRVNPADANYPFGSIKDNSSPGANDGTPLAAVWGNDWEGFAQAAMTEAGITPSGLPDTAQDSQLLDAVKAVASGALRPSVIEALRRSYAEAGYDLIGRFSNVGLVVNTATQVVLWEPTGVAYAWSGALPHTIGAGESPIGNPSWVSKANKLLRDSLSLHPITEFSSYNNASINAAWAESVAKYGYVYLPGLGTQKQYTVTGNASALAGTHVYVDQGTLINDLNTFTGLIGGLKFHGKCTVAYPPKSIKQTGGEVPYIRRTPSINKNPLIGSAVSFADCTMQTINGDVFTSSALGSSSSTAQIIHLATTLPSGLFAPIEIGEAITAHTRISVGSAVTIGLMLRCKNGWIKIVAAPNTPGGWSYQYKVVGSAASAPVPLKAPSDTLNSYSGGKASIGISLLSAKTFRFIVNGVSGASDILSAVGDIYEVGFIADGAAASSDLRITGLCSYKAADGRLPGVRPTNIHFYGDSTAAPYWFSTFDKYTPQLLDGHIASRSLTISNFAVSGEKFSQQLTRLQANGVGNATIICMVAGTNDVQGGLNPDTFGGLVTQFIDYCVANGVTAMLVEPWMWYPSAAIGGDGQPSSNYDNGAELREAGKRIALSRDCIYVSTTHELPAPLPEYYNSGLDPLLRDDLHQSELGNILYAELICSHIVEYLSRVNSKGRLVPTYWAGPKASLVRTQSYSKMTSNSLYLDIAVTGAANDDVLLNLPRGCRPDRTTTFMAMYYDGTTTTYKACLVVYANKQLKVSGLPASANYTFSLNLNW